MQKGFYHFTPRNSKRRSKFQIGKKENIRFEMCCFRITPITEIVTPCSSYSKFNVNANKMEFVAICGIAKPGVA